MYTVIAEKLLHVCVELLLYTECFWCSQAVCDNGSKVTSYSLECDQVGQLLTAVVVHLEQHDIIGWFVVRNNVLTLLISSKLS